MTQVNPYAAPAANVEEPETDAATPIVIGAAIGNGLAYALVGVGSVAFMWVLATQRVASGDIYVRLYQSVHYLCFAHTVRFMTLAVGGYWAARLSRARPAMNALLAGVIVTLFDVTQMLIPYEVPSPWWSNLASLVTPVPAFLLGAYSHRRRNERT